MRSGRQQGAHQTAGMWIDHYVARHQAHVLELFEELAVFLHAMQSSCKLAWCPGAAAATTWSTRTQGSDSAGNGEGIESFGATGEGVDLGLSGVCVGAVVAPGC